jgi:5-(carboxyamino)imidazole ribonucleotide mutase
MEASNIDITFTLVYNNELIRKRGFSMAAKVGIVMGSDSDLEIMSKAAEVLEVLKVEYDITVISAHRMPDVFYDYAKSAEEKGYKVIIAGAGGAAHLPGMTAAIFSLPVIGVPIMTKSLGGVDSLYSIVQMPAGIPVATVAINGAQNAGILAAKILAASDNELLGRIKDYAQNLKDTVAAKSEKLAKVGYKEYLKEK